MAKLTPGKAGQDRAQIVLDRLGVLAGERDEVHLELGVVRPPGVFGQLRAPDPLRHRAHPRIAPERLGHPRAQPERLVERGARHRGHVDQVVALAELRQEGGAEERQRRHGREAHQRRPRAPTAPGRPASHSSTRA